jgi:prevent-host-death family protein
MARPYSTSCRNRVQSQSRDRQTYMVLFGEPEMIGTTLRQSAEEVLERLPEVLDAAEKGHSTIITRRGRPVAVLAPVAALGAAIEQQPLTPWHGSGRGLWGKDSARTVRQLREEFREERGVGAKIGGGTGTFEPGQGAAVEPLGLAGDARLQSCECVERVGQRLAAVGSPVEGAAQEPRLGRELGANDDARRLPACLGIACPAVLRQTQRHIVVRPAGEPGGRLVVPGRAAATGSVPRRRRADRRSPPVLRAGPPPHRDRDRAAAAPS